MEMKLRETEGNQMTKANKSSAEEWKVVSSGLHLGAFLSYQRDTMGYCRHRKHSTKYRLCLNITSLIGNIRLENPLLYLILTEL